MFIVFPLTLKHDVECKWVIHMWVVQKSLRILTFARAPFPRYLGKSFIRTLNPKGGGGGGGLIKETAKSPEWIWGNRQHSVSLYATETELSAGGGRVNTMIDVSLPLVLNILTKQTATRKRKKTKKNNNFISSQCPLHQNVLFQGAVH